MEKQWRLKPTAPALSGEASELHPVVRQLLFERGLTTKVEIDHFLHPELHLKQYDPLLFRNMEEAIRLVISHIKARHKIVVCGDYDADGVTASAIMAESLRALKAEVDVWIPSRFGQGYGLNKDIITELKTKNVSLLITVDNGIRAKEEIDYGLSLGIDVIVTDHHEGAPDPKDLPNCLIINPILKNETYPFRYLCGAGVAYKFASALIGSSTLAQEDKDRLMERVVDLAAIGTIADCVSLLGENRLIVKQGMEVINHQPRLGLRELMNVSNIEIGEATEWNISWQITPRLNVAGRLDHANAAYDLLVTTSPEEARKLARELHEKNIERQRLTAAIINSAAVMIEKDQKDEKLLIVLSPHISGGTETWNEGVIGLAAGRLVERFSRPCFVVTKSEGKIKGSGRSIEQFSVGAVLEAGKENLERYGGHKMACGFTVKSETDLQPFIEKVRAAAELTLTGIDLSPVLWIDAELPLADVNDSFIETIEAFSPFGQDNPQPKFLSHSVIEEIMIMGKEKTHIKLRLGGMWALAFGRAEEWKHLQIGEEIDLVYTVCFNMFNNRREAQLKIVELRPAK